MAKTIRILFLSANPEGTAKISVIKEYKLIDSRIQGSKFRDQFVLQQSHAVSLMELQTLLLRFKPNIIHFSGHGSEKGELVFENHDGLPEAAHPRALSNLFKIINDDSANEDAHNDQVRCVVLNACYSLGQAKAISQHVDCVVGISDAIKDASATNFAASFYQGLAFGRSMNAAFELGRNQLGLTRDPDESILKLIHKDTIKPSKLFLASTSTDTSHVSRDSEADDRSRNLASHCKKLFEKADLPEEYGWLSHIDFTLSTSPIRKYGRQVLEHLYTGSPELFDLVVTRRLTKDKYNSEETIQERKIIRAIIAIFSKVGLPKQDRYTESFKFKDLAVSLIKGLKANKWPKFEVYRSEESPLDPRLKWGEPRYEAACSIGIENEDARLDKKLCLSLDQLTLELKQRLAPLYTLEEISDEALDRFNKGFREFNSGVETGASSLRGACKLCLSLEFHDGTEIAKYKRQLKEPKFLKPLPFA
jgi:hypothetical protein